LKRVSDLEASAPARPLTAGGTIVRAGKGYRIRLVLRDETGTSERSLEARSCADLAGAAAVQLGLLLHGGATSGEARAQPSDDASAARRSPGADEHPRTPPKAAPATTPQAHLEDDETGRERSWHVLLAAPLGSFHWGPLPKPAFGVAAAAGLELGAWQLRLGAELDASQRLESTAAPDYDALVSRQAGSVTLCRAWRFSAVDLAPCAGVWLEHVSARGEGPDLIPETSHRWWGSPAVAGLLRLHLVPAVALAGSLTVRIEGAQPVLSIRGLGQLDQLLPVSLALAVGPEWIF
jgi:hypothetical protein